MTRYVGIDLHKHLIVGHVVDPAGKKLDTFRYESVQAGTLEYIGQTRLKPEDEVALEASRPTAGRWARGAATLRGASRRLEPDGHQSHRQGQGEDR